MASLLIHNEEISRRLLNLAQSKQQSLEELLEDYLNQQENQLIAQEQSENENPIAYMMRKADELGLVADSDTISQNFDEELRKTWMKNPNE
jgi:predicted transcriptional regulator